MRTRNRSESDKEHAGSFTGTLAGSYWSIVSGLSSATLSVLPRVRRILPDGVILDLDYNAAALTGRSLGDNGVVVQGCGMDMGFDLVYSLGYAIWPKGTPKPHGKRNGEPDRDGGYALKHSWI